jgi:hypothetical protein
VPVVSAKSITLAGRRAIEAQMVDRCVVTRDSDPNDPGYVEPVMDPVTLQYPPAPRIRVYEGNCRVQVRSDINANAVEAVIGDHEFTYRTATLQLPIDTDVKDFGSTAAIRPDNVATILRCSLDPAMENRELNLQAESKGKTHATHRRFRIREVLS